MNCGRFGTLLLLPLLLLFGCAGQPGLPACHYQPLNPDLRQEPPPPLWFQQELERILNLGLTSGPTSMLWPAELTSYRRS